MPKFSAQFRQAVLELAAVTLIALLYISFILSYRPNGSLPAMELVGLGEDVRFIGLEHERLSGVLLPVELGLKQYGQIPTWNPYLSTGKPLLNNAFLYLLNPFHSLPILLLGGVQGSKLAIFIGLLLAGYNMWLLARALGIGAVGRVFAAGMYLLAGGIAGKFWQGHFQLGLSLAWPPLVFAGLWWTLHTTDRRAPALMAVAFALMFFAGNIYYTLHVIVCAVVITAFYFFERHAGRWRWDRLRRVTIGGLFALGLSMIQFWPVWAVRNFVAHEGDPELLSRYPMTQAIANFVYPWEPWAGFNLYPAVDYAYVGLVVFLFIAALAVAALSFRARLHRKTALIALILALLMTIWGAGQTPILQFLYANIDLLAEFRFPGRAHSIAALWWIILGAIAVDVLWRLARTALRVPRALDAYEQVRTQRVLVLVTVGWLYMVAYTLADGSTRSALVLNSIGLRQFLDGHRFTNFMHTAAILWLAIVIALAIDVLFTLPDLALRTSGRRWLRATFTRALRLVIIIFVLTAFMDVMEPNSRLFRTGIIVTSFDKLYPIIHAEDTETPYPAVSESFSPSTYSSYYTEVRNWSLNEGWMPSPLPGIIPWYEPQLNDLPGWAIVSNEYGGAAYDLSRRFVEENNYILRGCAPKSQNLPSNENCDLEQYEGVILYRLPEALPYAFIASEERLRTRADTLNGQTADPAYVLDHHQDTITIQAAAPENGGTHYLVVLETHFPGWVVTVDGVPVETVSVGQYIGVPLLPGDHTYILRYQPPGLALGLIASVISLLLLAFYLRGPAQQNRPPEQAA